VDDPAGPWEVWVRAGRQGGEKAAGRLVVLAYRPARCPVAVGGGKRSIGEKALLEATPPLGFRGPFRVRKRRRARGSRGAALEVVVAGSNEVGVTLEDQDGRRARALGPLRGRAGDRRRARLAGPLRDRRQHAPSGASSPPSTTCCRPTRAKDNLPPGWVVLELGPMPAAKVRDRMFQTLPYDGPPTGTDAQVAYRSKRFWSGLQTSARAGFASLGSPRASRSRS
jgi:hypothetical protein